MRKHKIYDENITGATKAVGAQLHYIINDTSKAGAFVWADPAGSANVKDVLNVEWFADSDELDESSVVYHILF